MTPELSAYDPGPQGDDKPGCWDRAVKPLRLALSVLLLAAVLAVAGAGARPRCHVWPASGKYYCWCYGAYGWRTAPALFCKVRW